MVSPRKRPGGGTVGTPGDGPKALAAVEGGAEHLDLVVEPVEGAVEGDAATATMGGLGAGDGAALGAD